MPVRLLGAGLLIVLVGVTLVLPSAPARLDSQGWTDLAARTIAGAYHIHSTRSDGSGDKAAIAAAARRAGLQFIILTDHGDGTRPPDPPVYIDNVLCLDGVEVSTDNGHYVALDMRPSPYPLGGAGEAVVDDVRGLSGFGVAAHPDSAKPALRWTDTDASIDAIEWLNGDSEWRTKSRLTLGRVAVAYLMRPAPALATLLERPTTLDRWDGLTATARVVGLAGADAHGGVGTRAEDGTRSGIAGVPTYEALFETFSTRVVLDRRLTGEAASDGRAVFDAIREGHVFTAIDALAGPALLDFHAEFEASAASPWNAWRSGRAEMGGYGPRDRRVTIVARAQKPVGSEVVLLRDGKEVARSATDTLRLDATNTGGAYRVEVRMTSAPGTPPIPWLVSNPIFFAPPIAAPTSRVREGLITAAPVSVIPASAWRIEKDPGSSAILRTANGQVELEYTLKQGSRASQYVAIAADLKTPTQFKAVRLRISADRPSRVSVQLRRADGARWGRSLFIDPTSYETDEPIARLKPAEPAQQPTLDPASAKSVLLVIDLTNAGPGRSGILRLRSSALVN